MYTFQIHNHGVISVKGVYEKPKVLHDIFSVQIMGTGFMHDI